jgi:protein involved in polysaccharide export with SLBB domain
MRLLSTVFCAAIAIAAPLAAEEYRLVVGDSVTLDYAFLENPKTTSIDLDGNIRLSELGSIEAQGKTLNEIEGIISQAMVQGGFSGVPFVTVEIAKYAPIVVSGVVKKSGLYEYVPGMTVDVAVALSGGASEIDVKAQNTELAALAAQRKSATFAKQIGQTVAVVARLEAAVEGAETEIELSSDLRDQVPVQELSELPARIAAETEILATERQSAAALLASWAKEVSESQVQIDLINERIILKEELIARLSGELDDAKSLQSQGLATTSRTSTLIVRLADEREDLLALETAKVVARRSRAMAERNQARFEAEQHQTRLTQLRDANNRLETLQRDYRFALNELALLNSNIDDLPLVDEWLDLEILLMGPRSGRVAAGEITPDTPLLPGDILMVRAKFAEEES